MARRLHHRTGQDQSATGRLTPPPSRSTTPWTLADRGGLASGQEHIPNGSAEPPAPDRSHQTAPAGSVSPAPTRIRRSARIVGGSVLTAQTSSATTPIRSEKGESTNWVITVAGQTGQIVSRAGRRQVMVLLAFSWSEHPGEIPTVNRRWPTTAQMLQMRNNALADRPSMILWYSLKDILQNDNPSTHWHDRTVQAFPPVPGPVEHRPCGWQTTRYAPATPGARSAQRRNG